MSRITSVATTAAAAGLLVSVLSCLPRPEFACSADAGCVFDGRAGTCNLPSQTCVYPSPSCGSGLADAQGQCVGSQGPTASTGLALEPSSGGNMASTGVSDSQDTEVSTSAGVTTDAQATTVGSQGVACADANDNITAAGSVGASSVLTGYPPSLAVDGDLSTSWLSSASSQRNVLTTFTWNAGLPDRCISRIQLMGNGENANPEFRLAHGFHTAQIRVLRADDTVVLDKFYDLGGSPDPPIDLETEGVYGSRIVLDFPSIENVDCCGGFSELRVFGE